MKDKKKVISIIVPVFNEDRNIVPIYKALLPIIESYEKKYTFEILFTDNHSSDDTIKIILSLCKLDSRIKFIRFSRNFGYQKSILTGYLNASGDAAIQIDCDLQDPPNLISDFLEAWEKGYLVVYGIRKTRNENFIIKSIRRLFYRIINFLSEDDLPLDAGDFRLIDRKIIEILGKIDDAQPYLRGAISAMGYKQLGIPYHRQAREQGKSNFKFRDLFGLAFDGILNHSIVPLRMASIFGLVISLTTIVLIIIYSLGKVYFDLNWPSGFTTLVVISLFGISLNALFLGIIGEYLGRIYRQIKKRPLVNIEKAYGFKDKKKLIL
jgi:glycosyltransferase involved in cell wall biosynthesis